MSPFTFYYFDSVNMKKTTIYLIIISTISYCCLPASGKALSGDIWAHDPSSIIKEGNKYWRFTTGDGINAFNSTDLFNWKYSSKLVFEKGTWPSWINSYVPAFKGVFWAPDIIKLNNRYCLYYACSIVGSPTSVIGMCTSPTLDQDSHDYKWTDQGLVISSSSTLDINAIDPSVFEDTDGKVYLSYGSFSDGIGVIELNALSGKVKSGAKLNRVAGGNYAAWEASCLIKEGNYYYLFANRARCCSGTSSTYYIVTGRSLSPTGPFLDKNGISLRGNNELGGGTTVLISSGRYIGPGQFGLLRDNGRNIVSMHYYDGDDNGNSKLDIADLKFTDDGWPIITRNLISAGRYKIINQNTGMLLDAVNCAQPALQQLVQNSDDNSLCQQWDLSPVGDGYYKISNQPRNQSIDVPFCNSSNGTNLQTWIWSDNDCQKYKIEQLANGLYVFTSLVNHTLSKVLQASAATNSSGSPISLFDYSGADIQQWRIEEIGTPEALQASAITDNSFTAHWKSVQNCTAYKLDVLTYLDDASYTTVTAWNFESGTNSTSSGIQENAGKNIAVFGTDNPSFTAPGNGGKTAKATGWNSNSAEKYWLININTQNYYNVKVSSIQRSSSMGPRHFKVQYKIGEKGTYTDVPGAVVSNADNFTSGIISSLSLPNDCDNQFSVYIRWLLVTNTNLNDGIINNSGESNIDDIIVTGNTGNFLPGYRDSSVNDTSLIIKNILPGTNYYYRVRSIQNDFTSVNSNSISVSTNGSPSVVFANIKAYPKNSNIEIDWTIFTQTDILRYDIEKSVNGLWFTQIGTTTSNGNKFSAQNNFFTDVNPGSIENSYRIKVVTKSGLIQYSPIVKAIIEKGQKGVFFYPNPVWGNIININLYESAKGVNKILLLNSLGQKIYETSISHPGGYSHQTLSITPNIFSGVYFFLVLNGNNKSVQKIIFN